MPTLDEEQPPDISHLDFEPALPCEYPGHSSKESAVYYVRQWCNEEKCSADSKGFLCREDWSTLENTSVICPACKTPGARNDCMKILDIVRSY